MNATRKSPGSPAEQTGDLLAFRFTSRVCLHMMFSRIPFDLSAKPAQMAHWIFILPICQVSCQERVHDILIQMGAAIALTPDEPSWSFIAPTGREAKSRVSPRPQGWPPQMRSSPRRNI